MSATNGAWISPARVAALPASWPVELLRRLQCPGVELFDELPLEIVRCSKRINATTIRPNVLITVGVSAGDDDLTVATEEQLDGFAFRAIGCILGVNLALKARP